MPAKRINADIKLTSALRGAGRLFQAGRAVDIAALRQSIDALRERRPAMCAALTDLIDAAEENATLGDRAAALMHFRAAIALAEDGAKAGR